ncbi:hypothetical protein [Streptomyces sp. URMC 129]|uniref:hypothetical protein n=1 Tax=Streptomyces sp. URMC 129 TaxID=3423407 RepID=UPI003F193511
MVLAHPRQLGRGRRRATGGGPQDEREPLPDLLVGAELTVMPTPASPTTEPPGSSTGTLVFTVSLNGVMKVLVQDRPAGPRSKTPVTRLPITPGPGVRSTGVLDLTVHDVVNDGSTVPESRRPQAATAPRSGSDRAQAARPKRVSPADRPAREQHILG